MMKNKRTTADDADYCRWASSSGLYLVREPPFRPPRHPGYTPGMSDELRFKVLVILIAASILAIWVYRSVTFPSLLGDWILDPGMILLTGILVAMFYRRSRKRRKS